MSATQTDIYGNILYQKEEITFTYEGPSFNGRMELPKLTAQLQSTEILLKELISELFRQKNLTNAEGTKVYLQLKKGSFQEIISIIFNHPLTISIVGGAIVVLFEQFLDRKKSKTDINIENLTNNYGTMNNINLIVNPLQTKGDQLVIKLPSNQELIINHADATILSKNIEKLKNQDDTQFEFVEEEFFGNLNSVNIKQGKFGFILEGTNRVIPACFDEKPPIGKIKEILDERVKIKARATYNSSELKKIDIIRFEIKKRKSLTEFMQDGAN